MSASFNPFSPVDIRITDKDNGLRILKEACAGKNSLLIASEGTFKRCGLQELKEAIEKEGQCVHLSKIPANPSVDDLAQSLCAIEHKSIGCIVAVGGGSCMDMGKSISAIAGLPFEGQPDDAQVRDIINNKKYASAQGFIDLIAVPTTAGTGSEVTRWATVWDFKQKEKLSVEHYGCYPKMALEIPEWMATMPARLTLSTGLDALCQAMESFWARQRNPLSQALSLDAVKRIKKYLPQVLQNLDDMGLRKEMALGSLIAGLAFAQTKTTACHSISYPLTMLHGVDHGFAAVLTLSEVMELNRAAVPEIAAFDEIFGGKAGLESWLNETSAGIQPLKLSAFGIKEEDMEEIAEKAFTQGRMDNNPVDLSQEQVLGILDKIY